MQSKIAPYLLSALITLLCLKVTAQPVVINQPFNDTLQCVGGSFPVSYTVNGNFKLNNIFRVVLSDVNGNFTSSSPNIGFGYGDNSGTATCTMPANIPVGVGYRIRIEADSPLFQSSPYISPNNGYDIRVSPYPTITSINTNSPVCAGDSLKLTVQSNSTAAEYHWTGPTGYNDTGHNAARINAPVSATGTYTANVTSYGCTSSDTISALVSPPPVKPVASTNSPVCERGDLEMVSSTTTPNVTSSWEKLNGPKISSFPNHIIKNVTPASSGTYVITVKIGNCTAKDTIYTVVKPSPDTPKATNNGPICEGDTLKLFASNTTIGVTYQWTGPSSFNSNQQMPIRPNAQIGYQGTYKIISYKDGCASIEGTTNVLIGNSITPPEVIGDTLLCPGDTVALTTRGGSGVFKWKLPNGSDYLGGAIFKPNASISDAGTYTLTVTQNGCVSPAGKITIKMPDLKAPLPKNNGPICEGEDLNITITGTDGGSYLWTHPNGSNSTNSNISITNASLADTGVYKITTTLDYCSTTDSTEVVINKVPKITDIGSNSPICYGSALQLNATADDSTAIFYWTGPKGFVSTKQNPTADFETAGTGTYSLTVTAKGCTSQPEETKVILRDGPMIPAPSNNGPVREGQTINLYAGDNKSGVEYRWVGPDSFKADIKDPSRERATILHAGTYTVYASLNGCLRSGTTEVFVITNNNVSVELFPNPNNAQFIIRGVVVDNKVQTVAIVSLFQRIIYKTEVTPDHHKFSKAIELGDIPSGDYYLVIGDKVVPFSVVRQ